MTIDLSHVTEENLSQFNQMRSKDNVVYLLKHTSKNISEIARECGVSYTTVSNIKKELEGKKMSKQYIVIANPTKADLDKIQVGDLVKPNNCKRPFTVKAVSDNYFIMVRTYKGELWYSICEKIPCAMTYNGMVEGHPTVGKDFWIFGRFDYSKQEDIEQCLQELERGQTKLSRTAIALTGIQYKRGERQ